MTDRRSIWAWGMESTEPAAVQRRLAAQDASGRFGIQLEPDEPPRVQSLQLRKPRITPPAALAHICSTDPRARTVHSYGHSFKDRVRKFDGTFHNPPDVVALPATEDDVATVLDWCSTSGYAAVPFGGGSSVVGGVEPPQDRAGVVSVDLTALNRVLEVDDTSRTARIQAGALGPVLEAQLRPLGMTLRHFPQSFEFSTLGGWIATRSGGHYATNRTQIDDFVQSVRLLTPAGKWESRRLPRSGAGPSPDRLLMGSEGALGIITEAWVRVQPRPRFRAGASAAFQSFRSACDAARGIVQAGLWPANCRVLDPAEARNSAGMDGASALLIIGFESAEIPQDFNLEAAAAIARDAGGCVLVESSTPAPAGRPARGSPGRDPAVAWRNAFINMPYKWDELAGLGLILDTFETAITWERWPQFDQSVRAAVAEALREVCGDGEITCRFTHVYPDGPAPYYTFIAPGKRGSELSMWAEIKQAASNAVLDAGGTITHHHAVGRDHRPWYDRQRPRLFGEALRAVKKAVDPHGVMNPGVLIDP